MAARDIGRLLRLSLFASAPADAAAGLVLGYGGWPSGGPTWLLPIASACVFHGGLALNDWADRAHDGRTRPERPIPSGAVSPTLALALGALLMISGAALAWAVAPVAGAALGSVALLALTYDLVGRGPWRGPILLGACRAGNLGAGLLAGWAYLSTRPHAESHSAWPPLVFLAAPLAYGLYVFLVSRLGRLEDGEDDLAQHPATPRRLLLGMSLALLTPAWLPLPVAEPALLHSPWPARLAAALLVGAAAWPLLRRAWGPAITAAGEIPPVMGMALRRLLIFSAALALVRGPGAGWLAAACILCGFPISHRLRRIFPPS